MGAESVVTSCVIGGCLVILLFAIVYIYRLDLHFCATILNSVPACKAIRSLATLLTIFEAIVAVIIIIDQIVILPFIQIS